jgi:hypothetical protein
MTGECGGIVDHERGTAVVEVVVRLGERRKKAASQ